MNDEQTAAAIDTLLADETYDLGNGRTLRLTTEPDDMSITDEQGTGVWCGQLEWDDRRRQNSYGYTLRPIGFDGGAEVIYRDGSNALWWQPMEDCKPGSEIRAAVRREILDLINYGYRSIILEVIGEPADIYGYRPVLAVASMGGFGPFDDDGPRYYLPDMIAEVLNQMEATQSA